MERDLNELKREEARKSMIITSYEITYQKNICSHFGCGKELSLFEALCGNVCVNHSGSNLEEERMFEEGLPL